METLIYVMVPLILQEMAHGDDVTRVLATCENCGSAYAARKWPGGTVKPIGSDECSCGSSEFVLLEETDDPASGAPGDE